MPLYEYECKQCHRRVEKIQKRFAEPLKVCAHCGGELARTLTAAAIQFKGGGWYKDLYSSAKPKSEGSSGESSGGGDKNGGEKSAPVSSESSSPVDSSASIKSSSAPANSSGGSATSTPAASSSSGGNKK
jgi:putative FmdB family regulatory protein